MARNLDSQKFICVEYIVLEILLRSDESHNNLVSIWCNHSQNNQRQEQIKTISC